MIPKLLIFASGTKTGGGSGFENLVKSVPDKLQAEIVGVVSSREHGGVRERAERLGVPFIYMGKPYTASAYQEIVAKTGAEFVALSGWLKKVSGLDPKTTFNIHPGPLPRFGGAGMYGHYVHEAVLAAYKRGEITHSAVSMHFVTEEYDEGPIFLRKNVPIQSDDTPETLGARVNEAEHYWQPVATNAVLHGEVHWDGKDPKSLTTLPDFLD